MVIDLEDTHGLQGSMKTQLSTGTTSGGCRQKSGAPTSSKERERSLEAADSAAVQVSSAATMKSLALGERHALVVWLPSENLIIHQPYIRYASVPGQLGNNSICKNSHRKSEPPAAKTIKKQAEARLIHLSETKTAFIINNNKKLA